MRQTGRDVEFGLYAFTLWRRRWTLFLRLWLGRNVRCRTRGYRSVKGCFCFEDICRYLGEVALFEEELWCRAFSVALTMRVGGRSVPLRLRCTSRAREGLRNSIHAILCSVSKRWHRPQLHGGNHLDRGVPSKYRPCKYIEHISVVWLMDNSLGCFLWSSCSDMS